MIKLGIRDYLYIITTKIEDIWSKVKCHYGYHWWHYPESYDAFTKIVQCCRCPRKEKQIRQISHKRWTENRDGEIIEILEY